MSADARGSDKFASKYSQFRISVEEEKGGGKQTNNGSFAFKDRLQKTRPGQNSPSVIISEHNSPFDGNTFVWLFVIYDHPVLRPFIHNSLNEPVIMAAPAQLTQGWTRSRDIFSSVCSKISGLHNGTRLPCVAGQAFDFYLNTSSFTDEFFRYDGAILII